MMNRRDFMTQALISAPLLGLTLPEPAKPVEEERFEPHWEDNYQGHATWFVFRFGLGETHMFSGVINDRSWTIRCGGVFRPEVFIGAVDEAKAVAEMFTAETLKRCSIAVEKIAYRIRC